LANNAFWPYKVNGVSLGYGTADVKGDPEAQKAAFRAVMPQLDGRRHLLYLSRIHPKKGCDLLIKGFAQYAASQPDLDLVIAGPDQVGMVEGLQALADKLGIGNRVYFPGMLSGDVKVGSYRTAKPLSCRRIRKISALSWPRRSPVRCRS
jgi:glycosyltransferase involved in cell wall biosynthesis